MKKRAHYLFGKKGEQHAAEYVRARGFRVLQTNCRTPYGEIDIIAKDKKTICFIEVKTRHGLSCGYPSESVTQKKKEHLIRSARYLLTMGKYKGHEYRFDILEVLVNAEGNEYHLITDAFDASE
jgi:putative endonuclease